MSLHGSPYPLILISWHSGGWENISIFGILYEQYAQYKQFLSFLSFFFSPQAMVAINHIPLPPNTEGGGDKMGPFSLYVVCILLQYIFPLPGYSVQYTMRWCERCHTGELIPSTLFNFDTPYCFNNVLRAHLDYMTQPCDIRHISI